MKRDRTIHIQSFYFYSSILSFCLGNLCAGGLTTAAFTAMMKLSQGIQSIQYVKNRDHFNIVKSLLLDCGATFNPLCKEKYG